MKSGVRIADGRGYCKPMVCTYDWYMIRGLSEPSTPQESRWHASWRCDTLHGTAEVTRVN